MGIFDSFRKKKPEESPMQVKLETPDKGDRPAMENGGWSIGDTIKISDLRLEVRDIIRTGGMGIVYVCYEQQLKRDIALKIPRREFLSNRKFIDSFRREALVWCKLEPHPNIVSAYAVRHTPTQWTHRGVRYIQDVPFILLQYVDGGSLDKWLRMEPLNETLAVIFAIQFCNGMEYAFEKLNLVHRDIKPSNILMSKNGNVKISDFGIAKAKEEASGFTGTAGSGISFAQSTMAGSFPYMSPEQWTRASIDTRSDIYSFGIVLYQMITRRYPYPLRQSNMEEYLRNHLSTDPMPIGGEGQTKRLESIIFKCLHKNPKARYQNFSELKEALCELFDNPSVVKEGLEVKATELTPELLAVKGDAFRELGEYEAALRYFTRGIEISPTFGPLWFGRGHIYKALGKNRQAISDLRRFIEIAAHENSPYYASYIEQARQDINELGGENG